MDMDTISAHRTPCVYEQTNSSRADSLCLAARECAVYDFLRKSGAAGYYRFEQERVGWLFALRQLWLLSKA